MTKSQCPCFGVAYEKVTVGVAHETVTVGVADDVIVRPRAEALLKNLQKRGLTVTKRDIVLTKHNMHKYRKHRNEKGTSQMYLNCVGLLHQGSCFPQSDRYVL